MPSTGIDHYRILQVDPIAESDVIRAAYRVLAQRFHPDISGGDAIMKRLNAAWEVLGHPDRRAEYDRLRASASQEGCDAPDIADAARRKGGRGHPDAAAGRPFGTVLTYGRYVGWSLGQIARVDPAFLEWLRSVPGGRYLREEIDAILLEVQRPPAFRDRWGAARSRSHTAGASIG